MRSQRGFTLVEMLVALAIAALLVSLVYGSVRVGQRSVRALDRQLDQTDVMRIGWQFVHSAIAHAGPAADPARTYSRTGFEGTADRLVFIATMPSYVGIEGQMRITLERAESDEGPQLVLTRERLDEDPVPTEESPIEQAVLVDRLEALRIEYFGRTERDTPPSWHDSWDGARRLPNLVRIQVTPSDGPAWPELTAAPQDGTAPLDEDVLPEGTEPDEAAMERTE